MTKTPYEIRLDLLKIAQELIDSNKTTQLKTIKQIESDIGRPLSMNEIRSNPELSSAYATSSTDDVIKSALELYRFVGTK
jgi:hypothetical protein